MPLRVGANACRTAACGRYGTIVPCLMCPLTSHRNPATVSRVGNAMLPWISDVDLESVHAAVTFQTAPG